MAQWVKSLLFKPRDLSLIPRNHLKVEGDSTCVSLLVLSICLSTLQYKAKQMKTLPNSKQHNTKQKTTLGLFFERVDAFLHLFSKQLDDRCSPTLLTISTISFLDLFIFTLWILVHVGCRYLQGPKVQDPPGAGVTIRCELVTVSTGI